MRKTITFSIVLLIVATFYAPVRAADEAAKKSTPPEKWSMKATAIEACSCPMFCPCYFDTKPAPPAGAHAGHGSHGDDAKGSDDHYCKFNMAYKIDSGHAGETKLDGAMFWIAGDLGGDFSHGETNWSCLTFDPSVTPAQREGIAAILGRLFPVKWKSFTVEPDKRIEWEATKDRAHAKLDGGKAAEVVLARNPNSNTSEPTVIKNLKYWGAPRNEGFVLMPNELNALRAAPKGQEPFEFKGTNGFMVTIDINSEDPAPPAAAK